MCSRWILSKISGIIGASMRVLIVEDERRLAENIARSLRESAGYAVDVALDGEDGLYMAQTNPYDLLVLDLMLPKVDGLVTNGGYGSVNQALSFGIPIVAAGLTEDKADVNVRIAWSGAGINLKTNNPTLDAIRSAVRTALDRPDYRRNAQRLAAEFATYDARAETLRLLQQRARKLKAA